MIGLDQLRDFIEKKYKNINFWIDRFPIIGEKVWENGKYNFILTHEPNEFFNHYPLIINNKNLFTGILTWSNLILNNCDNAVRFTYNGQTLDNDFINSLHYQNKNFNISFLCGTKNLVEGHMLRHKVYNLESQISIPKKWYYVLEDYDHKNDVRPGYGTYSKDLSHIPEGVDIIGYGRRVLFEDSMFNIVIENINHNNWYNKIGDNFLTKTIPIYWGCSNISEFGYDERGILRFNNENELLDLINNLTPEKYYNMLPYIEHNYNIARYDTLENNIVNFFDEFYKLNNL